MSDVVVISAGSKGGSFASNPLRTIADLWRLRSLVWQFTRRDLAMTYRGSLLGGVWAVVTAPVTFRWTHTGEGISGYRVQISVESGFPRPLLRTIMIPARSIAATEYTLSTAEAARLARMADRNGASVFYYRVRGEDAQKQFVTYSGYETTAAP